MKKRPAFVKEFVDQTFLGKSLSLDRRRFVRCKFYDVEFSYSGGPWHLENCEYFGECRCYWRGAARWTLNLVKELDALGFAERKARKANRT